MTSPDQGVTVTFSDGFPCSSGQAGAIIHVVCDAVGGMIEDVQVSSDYCLLRATVKSRAGCPVSQGKSGGLSAGSIILIM